MKTSIHICLIPPLGDVRWDDFMLRQDAWADAALRCVWLWEDVEVFGQECRLGTLETAEGDRWIEDMKKLVQNAQDEGIDIFFK